MQKLWIVKQILLLSTLGSSWRTVWSNFIKRRFNQPTRAKNTTTVLTNISYSFVEIFRPSCNVKTQLSDTVWSVCGLTCQHTHFRVYLCFIYNKNKGKRLHYRLCEKYFICCYFQKKTSSHSTKVITESWTFIMTKKKFIIIYLNM